MEVTFLPKRRMHSPLPRGAKKSKNSNKIDFAISVKVIKKQNFNGWVISVYCTWNKLETIACLKRTSAC